MAGSPRLDRALDRLAMWLEDRVPRSPRGFVAGTPGPLACFGPLPPLPGPPPASGRWTIPSPGLALAPGATVAASTADDALSVRISPTALPRRGTVLLVPPWKIRHARVVAGWSRLVTSARRDAWLYVPPHHLERAAGRRSGEAFVSADLGALRATVEQVVLELRLLVAAASAAGRGPVAIIGLSLGALVAALAATGPEPLEAAVLVGPPDLGVSLSRTRIGERYRALAARAGAPLPAALEEELAPFSPSLRRPTARRVLIAAGRHDLVVPLEAPLALARSWGVEPRVYPRGHLTLLLACRALRRDVAAFLDA